MSVVKIRGREDVNDSFKKCCDTSTWYLRARRRVRGTCMRHQAGPKLCGFVEDTPRTVFLKFASKRTKQTKVLFHSACRGQEVKKEHTLIQISITIRITRVRTLQKARNSRSALNSSSKKPVKNIASTEPIQDQGSHVPVLACIISKEKMRVSTQLQGTT